MWFLAQEIFDSTTRGVSCLSSSPMRRIACLHHGLLIGLVIDGEVFRQAFVADPQRLDIAPQHAHAEGVKGGDERLGQGRVAEKLLDALGHLGGSLVGEGDGEDGVWRDAALLDEVSDAVRDDARLARAGSGEDEHRAVDGFDGLTLLGIEFVE